MNQIPISQAFLGGMILYAAAALLGVAEADVAHVRVRAQVLLQPAAQQAGPLAVDQAQRDARARGRSAGQFARANRDADETRPLLV